jgi:hypothetical protein
MMISRCRNRSAAPTSRACRSPPKTGSNRMTGRRATSTDRTRLTFGPLRRQSTLVASPAQSNTARAITSAGRPAGEESGNGPRPAADFRSQSRLAFLLPGVTGRERGLRSWKLTWKGRLSAISRRGHGLGMRHTCPPPAGDKGFRTQRLRYLRLIAWGTARGGSSPAPEPLGLFLRPGKFPQPRQRARSTASHQPVWDRSARAVRLSEACP